MLNTGSKARRTYQQVTTSTNSSSPLPEGLLRRLRSIPEDSDSAPRPLPSTLRTVLENIARVRPRLPQSLSSPALSFALTLTLVTGTALLSESGPAGLVGEPLQLAESHAALQLEQSTRTLSSWVTNLNHQVGRTRIGILELRDHLNSGIATFGKLSLSTAENSK